MFWRRARKDREGAAESAAPQDGDMDLAKLQRQFGIQTVSDKDVEAEFLKLLGGKPDKSMGSALGLSPRSELALFGAGGNDSDEEAQILRQLNLSGDLDSIDVDALSGGEDGDGSDADGDGDDGAGARLAQRELHGVLGEAHREAKRNASKNDPLAQPTPPRAVVEATSETLRERIHTMKLRAVALKREGNTQEALAVFREVKTLEAQLANGQGGSHGPSKAVESTTSTTTMTNSTVRSNGSSVVTHRQQVTQMTSSVEPDDGDEKDVDVTDEDMDNPEYLAQLAALGFPVVAAKQVKPAAPVETVESLEQAIRETKEKAVQFKRSDRITEALAEMRKIKELEARLAELRANAPLPVSAATAAAPVTAAVQVVTALPEPANDSDVEVTDDDMNDPAFAAELQKLGFDPTHIRQEEELNEEEEKKESEEAPPLTSLHYEPPSASAKTRSYANRYSSVDDSDLIDEFEDDDDEEEESGKEAGDENIEAQPPASAVALTEEDEGAEGPQISAQVAPAPLVTNTPEPKEIREPSNGSSIEDLQAQLEKTKLSAVQLKRQGNVQAALDMMRRMKQIENLIEMKRRQAPATPVVTPEEQERRRKFGELEALLVRLANEATREAKEQLSVDRAKAAEWLAKRKEYSAQLVVLREKRQVLGQDPPSFYVEQVSEQVEVERTDIPLDEVHMTIESVNELSQAAGKDVFVKFNLGFPSSAPHEGKTGSFRISSTPPHSGRVSSENAFKVKVQRGRGTQRLFEIKKAVFEVWRPGSLLRNPEMIARGYQELAPLLTTSELKTRVIFVGSNRKPVGGDVEITLRMRTPLRDKEFNTVVTEILRIGDYPPPQAPVLVQQAVSRPAARSEPVSPVSAPHARPHSQSEVSASTSTVTLEGTNSSTLPRVASAPSPMRAPATPAEPDPSALEDPHDLDLIVSYDVINDEIERIEAALPNLQGEAAAEYSDRLDSLGLKKQLLEIDMQTGKLTLDNYVVRLKQRILDDRAIIKRLMKSGRKPDAARVLHRVKIMEKELEGAEQQDEQEDVPME